MPRGWALLTAIALLVGGCGGSADDTTTTTRSSAASSTGAAGGRADLDAVRVALTPVARLDEPLDLALAPSGDGFLVAEKGGLVRLVRSGAVAREPVLDLRDDVSGGGEQGLLGIAVSRDGRFLYADLTDRRGDTHVAEFALAGERADPRSRRDVLVVDQPYANHNGGDLDFGPDGLLYVSLGDGGSAGDPAGNAQSLGTLLGKILRIDPRPSGDRAYGIPADNPFVGRSGARPEIWVYGLRNPWRFSFDRATGDLWIGDVGQDSWEEIDRLPAGAAAGANLGWDRLEGSHRFEGEAPPGSVPPIHEYSRTPGTCAVTGGYVYRGTRISALRGVYVFADFCVGELVGLATDGGRVTGRRTLGPRAPSIAGFAEDADGELYVLSLEGELLRLDPSS